MKIYTVSFAFFCVPHLQSHSLSLAPNFSLLCFRVLHKHRSAVQGPETVGRSTGSTQTEPHSAEDLKTRRLDVVPDQFHPPASFTSLFIFPQWKEFKWNNKTQYSLVQPVKSSHQVRLPVLLSPSFPSPPASAVFVVPASGQDPLIQHSTIIIQIKCYCGKITLYWHIFLLWWSSIRSLLSPQSSSSMNIFFLIHVTSWKGKSSVSECVTCYWCAKNTRDVRPQSMNHYTTKLLSFSPVKAPIHSSRRLCDI